MPGSLKALLVTIILLVSISNGVAHTSRDISHQFENYLQPYVKSKDFYGNILIEQAGEIIFEQSFGYAKMEWKAKHTSKSLFQIASLSNSFN